MEKIYHEAEEKSGHYNTNSPCIQVRAYIPDTEDDYDLPAIIIQDRGYVSSSGGLVFAAHNKQLVDTHDKSFVIRKAIQLFDELKAKVFAEEGGA